MIDIVHVFTLLEGNKLDLKNIDWKAIGKKEEAALKVGFEFDSVRRTHAMHAGLSGVSLAGIFTCISVEEQSGFLIAALCCYSICLPCFVASYLFHEMQLARKDRKLLEYRELIYHKVTIKIGTFMWFAIAVGVLFTILHLSKLAGVLFTFSSILCFIVFCIYYFWQLTMEIPSNNKINRTEDTSAF